MKTKLLVFRIALQKLLFICILLPINHAYAAEPLILQPYNTQLFDAQITSILNHLPKKAGPSKRMAIISQQLLGKPYLLGSLGEGSQGKFDQNPLYRTDSFNCVTFVSTVLALNKAKHLPDFVANLKRILYKKRVISYYDRCHFMETDWNSHNQKNGYIQDITAKIYPFYKKSYVYLNEPQWYIQHTAGDLKLLSKISNQKTQQLVTALHQHSKKTHKQLVTTNYIPLTSLFTLNGSCLIANEEVFTHLPAVSIIEIIDRNQNLKEKIGTNLNIVHLGFAIKTPSGLIFRHASKIHHIVMDVPLEQYLRRSYKLSYDPSKEGIHIEKIL